MTVRNKPESIDQIWASNGDVESPSSLKIETGWLPDEKPFNQYFNHIDNKQDKMLAHINQVGVCVWDQDTSYKAATSYVQGGSGSIFRAKLDNQNVNPDTDTSEITWKKVLDFGGAVNLSDVTTFIKSLFQAEDGDELLDDIGATPVGKSLVFAGDEEAARDAIGGDVFYDRANHTGTQAQNTVVNLESDLSDRELLTNKATDLTSPNNTKYPTTLAVATAIAAATAGETYQGQWNAITNTPTLVDSTGAEGDVWQVSAADPDPMNNTELDGVDDWGVGDEVVFTGGVWTKRENVIPSLDTDDVTEATNLYFSDGRVRSTPLTGLSTASSSAIDGTDTVLSALGKLQAQLNALSSRLLPSGGSTGQVLAKTSATNYAVSWQNSTNSLSFSVNNIGAGTKTLDCSSFNYWNITGNGAATITNLPTGSVVFNGYVRFVGTSLSFSAAGKSFSWVGGVTPTLSASLYNLIRFENVLGGSTVNLMLVDQGAL